METRTFPEFVPQHNWDSYQWTTNTRSDRLYQGPFPAELVPNVSLVMTTLPSEQIVPNFGMGLMAYIIGDLLPQRKNSESVRETIEKLAQIPMASKLYIRSTWREMQSQRGRLNTFEHWQVTMEMAEKYNKRVGFRIMINNPSIRGESVPDFILKNVPMFNLGKYNGDKGHISENDLRVCCDQRVPYYHHPYFLEALEEFDALLADKYNGSSNIEFVDSYMYGFWGEGHTWPLLDGSPFPDHTTASETWLKIFEMQHKHWDRTPLVTNTQPDDNHVGNAEVLEQTIRTGNWIRSDSIFAENQQIEVLSNRPAHIACICEGGMSDGTPDSLKLDNGMSLTENMFAHVKDLGANYMSLWNWHNIHADHVMSFYHQNPDGIDKLNRSIGYRIRPSWIWTYKHDNRVGLVLGLVNDGIAGVPGFLRLTLFDEYKNILVSGTLDAGYPEPHKVRQARLVLPANIGWEGKKLKAELIVKGAIHPVQWACHESLNLDGSLTMERNLSL